VATAVLAKLHIEEFNYVYASPNIINMTSLWRVGWAGDVSHMGEMRSSYKILSQKI
jgi:hypothetical protein